MVGSATAVAPGPGFCGVCAACLVSNEAASEGAEHADAQARVGVGEGVMYQVAGVLDGAARAVIVSGGRVVISTAAGLAPCWWRERPGAATMRGASAWVRVEAWYGGIRGCIWIERGLRLMIWQAGVGRHRNGARCVGPRGSARVVVVCRSGSRPGVLIITVIGGHNGESGTAPFRRLETKGRTESQGKMREGWEGDVVLGITAGPRSGQVSDPGIKGRECGKVGEGGMGMGNGEWEM